MASVKGYLLLSLGCLLLFGGTVQSFNNIGRLTPVLTWAVVALVGVFVLSIGIKGILSGSGEEAGATPENAPGKTD